MLALWTRASLIQMHVKGKVQERKHLDILHDVNAGSEIASKGNI